MDSEVLGLIIHYLKHSPQLNRPQSAAVAYTHYEKCLTCEKFLQLPCPPGNIIFVPYATAVTNPPSPKKAADDMSDNVNYGLKLLYD